MEQDDQRGEWRGGKAPEVEGFLGYDAASGGPERPDRHDAQAHDQPQQSGDGPARRPNIIAAQPRASQIIAIRRRSPAAAGKPKVLVTTSTVVRRSSGRAGLLN
jgi:hypothetical protein